MDLFTWIFYFLSILSPLSPSFPNPNQEPIDPSSVSSQPKFLPVQANIGVPIFPQPPVPQMISDSNNASPQNSDIDFLAFLMDHLYFYGSWQTINGQIIPKFNQQDGYAYMHFESLTKYSINLHAYDGPYVDGRSLSVYYNFSDGEQTYNKENSTLKMSNVQVLYQIGVIYGDVGSPETCLSDITMYFINTTSNKPFVIDKTSIIDPETLGVQIEFTSEVCTLNIITSTLTQSDMLFDSQVYPYIFVMVIMAITQCTLLYFFDQSMTSKPYIARRTSSWSLVVLNAFDLYLFLTISYSFLTYSPWFELTSLPYAFLAFCFEPKVIWGILQIQRESNPPNNQNSRELKTYFVMMILFLAVLISLVIYPDFAYILSATFLVPQIVHNFETSYKHRWNLWLIGGLFIPKVFFTLYTKLDASNLLRITPNPTVLVIYFSLFLFQILILAIQTKFPRFGFEKEPVYTIYCSKSSKSKQELCAICLEKLKESFGSPADIALIPTVTTLKDHRKIITPCHHEFHFACLVKWFDSKLECPYCRKTLPHLPEEYLEDD